MEANLLLETDLSNKTSYCEELEHSLRGQETVIQFLEVFDLPQGQNSWLVKNETPNAQATGYTTGSSFSNVSTEKHAELRLPKVVFVTFAINRTPWSRRFEWACIWWKVISENSRLKSMNIFRPPQTDIISTTTFHPNSKNCLFVPMSTRVQIFVRLAPTQRPFEVHCTCGCTIRYEDKNRNFQKRIQKSLSSREVKK